MGNALISYVAYLGQFLYPVSLAVVYPRRGLELPWGEVFEAFLVLASITAAALVGRRRYPYLLVGWLWYLGMLVPVIGLLQVGITAAATASPICRKLVCASPSRGEQRRFAGPGRAVA